MLNAGIAKADITAHAGVKLCGFGKRVQPSLGVTDPLYATALVISDSGSVIALVSCDLTLIYESLASDVRKLVNERTGIPENHIMVTCTHTHYAPDYECPAENNGKGTRLPSYERAYYDYIVYQIAGAIIEAYTAMQPVKISVGFGTSDIGINRREKTASGEIILGNNPDGPIDRTLGVCRIDTLSGKPLAVVVNFTTHPVTQEPQLRLVSSDYVGYMRNAVEESTGAVCIFWQGAAGNINPIHAEADNAATRSLGEQIGRDILSVWKAAGSTDTDYIRTLTRHVKLPAFRFLSEKHAAERLQQAKQQYEAARKNSKTTQGLLDWMVDHIEKMETLKKSWSDESLTPPPVDFELQVFRIGQLAWACIPCELFNEIGAMIKQTSPFKYTFFVAYANGYQDYVPTVGAYEEGGYEVDYSCRVGPEATEILVRNFKEMFGELV